MKVYWEYECDYGHYWTVYREEDAEERPEDAVCSYGHPAVTLYKSRPLDLVQITLRPAAKILDDVKNQIGWERHYWLILSDIDNTEELVSEQPYLWRDVLELAEKFHGHSKASAWKLWDNLKP